MFLEDHAETLLAPQTDTALDEIALGLPDAGLIQPFRDLIEQARQAGIDAACRPWLAAALLDEWLGADWDKTQSMLVERRNELLDSEVAAALASRLADEPDDPTLAFHAALLALARMDRAALVFGDLSAPDEIPRRLTELARAGDLAALEPMTRLLLHTEQPDPVRAAIWFHRAIVLAVHAEPQDAQSALHEARKLDPGQAPVWLSLLAGLGPAHPQVLLLSQALMPGSGDR